MLWFRGISVESHQKSGLQGCYHSSVGVGQGTWRTLHAQPRSGKAKGSSQKELSQWSQPLQPWCRQLPRGIPLSLTLLDPHYGGHTTRPQRAIGQHEREWKWRSLQGSQMSMKDFPRDKASEAAGCRRAQVNTVGGGADVAVTHLSVDKKIALSVVSGGKPEYFEEQLVRNVKRAAQWQMCSARLLGWAGWIYSYAYPLKVTWITA